VSGFLFDAHLWWAWVVVVGNGLVGLWALAAHQWPQLRHRALWWCTGAAYVAVAIQVVLGTLLVTREDREAPQFHMFYGFVALASVGIIYSYRHQLADRRYLLFGFGSLFVMGLAIRAMVVGPNR
jgi:hypothetical protein